MADNAADRKRPLTLRLADGTTPPPWLLAALAALLRRHAGSVWMAGNAGRDGAGDAPAQRAGTASLVLHLRTVGAADVLEPSATHWALCDGAGRALCLQHPLRHDISAGRGIALRCLEHDPASGRWHERRALRVAASALPARGAAALAPACERLLTLALASWRLDLPLQAAAVSVAMAPAPPPAGLLQRAWQGLRGSVRAAGDRLAALALSESWRVGVIDAPVAQLLQEGPLPPVRWLTTASAAGYWADPFGLPGDAQRLACEFFDRSTGRGHIECLTLDAAGQVQQRRALVVGAGGHASFPLVCEIDGQRVGIAETLDAGACMLHAVDLDGDWRPLWPLLHGVAAADPALFQWQGRYWLAYTDTALGAQDNLCLQHADTLRGPWLPHAANPVKVDAGSARMAGSLFVLDGMLVRPGQDCLRGYGGAVVLHRIDQLTPTAFAETAMRRLAPESAGPCPHGLHTVSGWGARTLVDGKRLSIEPRALLRKLQRRAGGAAGPHGTLQARRAGAPHGAPIDAPADAPGAIFVYVPHLRTGGGELSMLALAAGFADAGRAVWLVVHTARTQEQPAPPGVQLLSLQREGTAGSLWQLVRALRAHRPQWLVSAFPHSNVAAIAAVALARCGTRCVVTEHAPLSLQIAQQGGWRYRLLPPLLRWAYPRAAAVVAVSDGVRDDLLALAGTAAGRLAPVVIRNPVLPPTLDAELALPPDHPWLLDAALQVVLSVGRLAQEKDLPTLLRAFASVHRSRPQTRLLLAGDGPERARLEALVAELGLQAAVQLPGRTGQPLRWMRHAAVLVLASRFEGFGNVLVEALACGTPVVATDCPVGPREILQHGRFGALVPVGDSAAMAAAIVQTLTQAPAQRALPPGARDAALQHTRQRAAAAYLALFDDLAGAGGRAC